MGIDPANLTNAQLRLIAKADRKKLLGKKGMTAAEAAHIQVVRAERKIHDQFCSFCRRNKIPFWHSSPVKRSSIRSGLPDFLLWKGGRAVAIEFKVPPHGLDPLQKEVIAELETAGNQVVVCIESEPGSAYTQAVQIVKQCFDINEEA